MICDLCGKAGKLYKTEIEGSRIVACESCAKYGKVFHEVKPELSKKQELKQKETAQARQMPKVPEVMQMIVKDFASKIKNAREKKGIKQEDFAKLINIKDSLLLHIESGKMEPNMDLAHKLEKTLGIKLIEEIVLEPEEKNEKLKMNGPMTLGDFITIKKR